jgi:hypothetical protein
MRPPQRRSRRSKENRFQRRGVCAQFGDADASAHERGSEFVQRGARAQMHAPARRVDRLRVRDHRQARPLRRIDDARDADLHDIGHRFGRRADVAQLAAMQDRDGVTACGDVGQHMRRQHQRVLAAEVPHEFAQLERLHRIEAGRGLVEHDEIGFVDDRLRHADALAIAFRQRTEQARRDVAEVAACDRAIDGARDRAARDAVQRAQNARYSRVVSSACSGGVSGR